MNIEELRAAIERTRGDYEGSNLAVWKRAADKEAIANAFTNPAPVTREGLEAMGVVGCPKLERRVMFGQSLRISCFDDGETFIQMMEEPFGRWCQPRPIPETMGDVCFLIWRLTRTPTGG